MKRLLPLALLACVHAGPNASLNLPLDAQIPPDTSVRTGVLPNGLRYYVEKGEEPADRATLRLALRAGSMQEDPDQLGLAHFVEHMAFNGTEHFPGNSLIAYLESVGTKFGAHINAHTSFDETIYKLEVPTDDAAVLDKAMVVLEDWACCLTFDPAEIEAERGVVLEEWRRGQGAGFRVSEQTMPLLFGENYASRKPIGTEASLKTFAPEALTRFYQDWYRPDLMAVIAVGDFDVDAMEKDIIARFSDLQNPASERPRAPSVVPSVPTDRVKVISDPELTDTEVTLLRGVDDVEGSRVQDFKDKLIEDMLLGIFAERTGRLSQSANPPFIYAGAAGQRLGPTEGIRQVYAGARLGDATDALRAMLTEWERIERHGVLNGELERAKSNVLLTYEQLLARKADAPNVSQAEELVRVFTNGEFYTNLETEVGLSKRLLGEIGTSDLNKLAATWMTGDSRVVLITLPAGPEVPSEAEVAAILAEVDAAPVDAPVENEVSGPIVEAPPKPGSVVSREEGPAGLGYEKWTLSNGAELWWRRTDFTTDQILFSAFSKGGIGGVKPEDRIPAATALSLVEMSGLGPFRTEDLSQRLAGHELTISPWISLEGEGFSGSARKADLDLAFELLHAYATVPRWEKDAFGRYLFNERSALQQRLADPEARFWDRVTELSWPGSPHRHATTLRDLEEMNMARSQAIYLDRFSDFSDFVFVVTGDFDPAALEDAAAKWIASLPGGGRDEAWGDDGARPWTAPVTETVRAGTEPKATVHLSWHGAIDWNSTARNRMFALSDILSTRLRKELRERLGGVYGVSASVDLEARPTPTYAWSIDFTCDPGRVDELIAAAKAQIEGLRTNPPTEQEVADAAAKSRRDREIQVQQNGFWQGALSRALQDGEDPADILNFDERNRTLSPAEVHRFAQQTLTMSPLLQAVRLPEE